MELTVNRQIYKPDIIHRLEKDGGCTTMPCERNRAISTHRKPYFGETHPCSNKIVQGLRFEDLFCAFLRAVLGFSCAKYYG